MGTFVATIFIIVCLLLIVVILLQKGRGGGLSGAFGGMGSSAFGTRTGDVFTWITIGLVVVFLLFAIFASLSFHQEMPQVATPRFDPASKPISQPERIIIQAQAGARVFYTLDGTTPTRESIEHDVATVPIQPGQTIKAIAYMRGWKDSKVAVGTYPDATRLEPTTTTAPADTPAPAN